MRSSPLADTILKKRRRPKDHGQRPPARPVLPPWWRRALDPLRRWTFDPSASEFEWVAHWTPRVFCILATALGLTYGVLMPPLQIPDEGVHLARAYTVSRGDCVAPANLTAPRDLLALWEEFPHHLELHHPFSLSEGLGLLHGSMDESKMVAFSNVAGNLYTCVPYVPASLGFRAGRRLHLSVIADMYLCRLINLSVFVFLTWLALRLLPDFHLLLMCLALMPMTLHQAASLSADGLTISSGFLLSAYTLRLGFAPALMMGAGQHIRLAGLIALSSLCKFNVWMVLLAGLIPAVRFGGRRNKWLAMAGYVTLACSLAALWQTLNWHNAEIFRGFRLSQHISMDANGAFVFEHPILFLHALYNSAWQSGLEYVREFIGQLGWLSVPLFPRLIQLYSALIVGVALTQTSSIHFHWRLRVLSIFVTLATTLSLFILLWTFSTTADYIAGPMMNGKGLIGGIQGRYFIPFVFPALLVLTNTRLRVTPRLALPAASSLCAFASYVAYRAIRTAFYTRP